MSVDRLLEALDRVEPGAGDVWLADALWDEFYPQYIEARDALVAKALDPLVVDHVRKAALRSYVETVRAGGDPAAVVGVMLDDFAQMVDVAKAGNQQIQRDGWVQYVNRDEKGRFSRRAVQSGRAQLKTVWDQNKDAVPVAVRNSDVVSRRGEFKGNATDEQKEQIETYLADWMQTRNLRAELMRRLDDDTKRDSELRINFVDGNLPQKVVPKWDTRDGERDIEHGLYDGRIASYELVPKSDLPAERQIEVGRRLDAAQKMDLLGAQNVTAEQMNSIMSILEPGSTETTRMSRVTGILQGASSLASGVGMKDTGVMLRQAAAATEAGEALRPALTRAAYRYRGMEKTQPDRQFADAAAFAVAGDEDKRALDALTEPKALAKPLPGDIVRDSIAQYDRPAQAPKGGLGRDTELMPRIGQRLKMWQQDPQGRAPTTDQVRLGVQRDRVAEEFVRRQTRQFARRTKESVLPDGAIGTGAKSLRKLIQEIANGIGRDLPSEGVVIDAKGRVVSQAVGVGGDHYNPFGVKARKALSGGQYVRTRQLGGMTTDDIRTLLTTNARAGTVVSASGVFDLEFDPDFRNQKRLSERALGMVDTYERILDQLAAEQIYARDLDPEVEAKLREQARTRNERAGGKPGSEEETKIFNSLRDAARRDASKLSTKEIDKIKSEVSEISGLTPIGVADEVQRRVAVKEKEKVRQLSLNGEGYEVALRTLQSYYPYFIRDVSRRGVGEFMDASNAMGETRLAHHLAQAEKSKDQQYVRPGAVRSGSDAGAGAGLPKPKERPWREPKATAGAATDQQAPDEDEESGAPSSGGGAPRREQPATDGGGTGDRPNRPEPTANGTDQMAEVLFARARKASNNADALWRDFGQALAVAEDANEESIAEAIGSPIAEWENKYMEAAVNPSNYTESAWKSDTVDAATQRRIYDLSNPVEAPKVMREMTSWINGDANRYNAMLKQIQGWMNEGLIVDDAAGALIGALEMATAVSLAKRPWRGLDQKFDGRPAMFPELRDASNDEEMLESINTALKTATSGDNGYPDPDGVDVFSALADSEAASDLKLVNWTRVQRQLKNSQEIEDFIASTSTAQGPLSAAPEDVVAREVGTLNKEKVDDWIAIRTGLPAENLSEQERDRLLVEAAGVGPDDVQERRDNAEMYYSSAFASLILDAAQLAAQGLSRSDAGPKVLAQFQVELPEGVDAPEDLEEQGLLYPTLERAINLRLFEVRKSRRSPRGVRVLRDSPWEALVKEQVSKGVPPQVAVLRTIRNSRR